MVEILKMVIQCGKTSLYGLATTLFLLFSCTLAAQVNGAFNVTVNLLSNENAAAPNNTVFCRSSPPNLFGAEITVLCSTGEIVDFSTRENAFTFLPFRVGTYRYVLRGVGGAPVRILEDFSTLGTVTSWRQVNSSDSEYIEIMVGW